MQKCQELAEKYVWIEIPFFDGFNLLISSHRFAPDTIADILKWYFGYLQYVLDTPNFNLPIFKEKLELSPAISHDHNKLIHYFSAHVYLAYLSKIIPAAVTSLTLYFLISLISLLNVLYMCLCLLILITLFLSLKCSYLLECQIGHLMFISESTLLVITYYYTAPL